MTSLRRYAPFALLVAAQLVLVLVAPSRGASSGSTALGGQFSGAPTSSGQSGTNGTGTGSSTAPGGSSTAPGSVGSGATAPGATGTGATAPGGATTSGGGTGGSSTLASGNTTGGTFCVTGLLEHSPCMPKWAGGSNGGATWQGVTASTITVVMYRYKDNAAVDAILRETGTYISPQDEEKQALLVTDWINKHYQLYGRKLKLVYYQGSCDIAPPVDSCFRGDADNIVAKYHPFAFFYDNNSNEPAVFDELSRKGVINWGGWAFTDSFNDNLRPYHYDLFMGGDTQAEITGKWYCQRLANQDAKYAGDALLKTKKRKVAVVYANTTVTTPAAKHLENIIKGCAPGSVVDAPYSSDTSTAAQQSTTDTAKYKSEGVTTLLWFSDPIAPAYGTKAEAAQDWHPEEVIAGEGLLDYDSLAQTYDQSEWSHAFGPSDLANATPINEVDAGRIWKAEGQSGNANASANLLTTYELSMATGIMAAGPKLNPLTYEYGMLTLPGYDSWSQWHDPRLTYIKFGKNDYTGISDIREVYFSTTTTSPYNGRAGAYIPLNGGRRYDLSDVPSGDPHLPTGV